MTETQKHYVSVRMRIIAEKKNRSIRLARIAGVCRYVRNSFIRELEQEYKLYKQNPEKNAYPDTSYFGLRTKFTQWVKKRPEEWIREISPVVIKYNLKSISDTYKRFFKTKGKHGRPRILSRDDGVSFNVDCSCKETRWIIDNELLNIPRLGRYIIKGSNLYKEGRLTDFTVLQELDKWYAILRYEIELPVNEIDESKSVGIDFGVVSTVTTSDGKFYRQDKEWLEKKEAKIKRYQKKLACQKRRSKRRELTKDRMKKRYKEIRNKRKDFSHQISRKIVNQYDFIVMEDLKLLNMTASAKGTLMNPGKNVRQKAGLNRSILNQSIGTLRRNIIEKSERESKMSILVDPKYTSQRCSSCGEINKESRQSQSKYICIICGFTDNADINAAKNIMARGTGATGHGGLVNYITPMKCQQGVLELSNG